MPRIAAAVGSPAWNTLSLAGRPLDLRATLSSGQCFRWTQDADGVWLGAVGGRLINVAQSGGVEGVLRWRTLPARGGRAAVEDYFRLNVNLDALYRDWISAVPQVEETLSRYRGLRVVRQPPEECLFVFLCASCNTMVKIQRSVRSLAAEYGAPLGTGPPHTGHAFPTAAALAGAEESTLRAALWGFRAPRVIELARKLVSTGPDWAGRLRDLDYPTARAELTGFFGVGPKIADCVCLFSLDKDQAVPVDTHVRQIACSLFTPELAEKSLTPRVYETIARAYRDRFGDYAGWAQQYLFHARASGRRRT